MPPSTEEDSSGDEVESSEEGNNDSSDDGLTGGPWPEKKDPPAVKSLMLAFMFMFQGYGAMVGNPQHALKHMIRSDSDNFSEAFQDATASFQLAKLVMRLAQIAFLVFVQPNGIVYMAYVVMMVALSVPLILIWGCGINELWVVYLQYSLGGVAVGLFEGTFLSVISSLGKNTKTFAIMGAPLGFFVMNTILGTFSYFHMSPIVYYIWGLVCLPVAIVIFHFRAPKGEAASSGKGCQVFMNSVKKAHQWFPKMIPWFIAKFIGNFVLEDGFPLLFNTYNTDRVPLGGPAGTDGTVPLALYLSLFWFPCMALGDTISRRVPAYIPLTNWKVCIFCLTMAIIMCIGGEALDFLMVGVVNGLAVFIANFGNGFIYGLSAKYIDGFIPEEHRYTSYNLWCFVGDLGGYAGQSSLSVKLAEQVCRGNTYTYVCAPEHAHHSHGISTTIAAGAATASTAAPTAAPDVPPAQPAAPELPPAPTLPTLPPLPDMPTLAPPVMT